MPDTLAPPAPPSASPAPSPSPSASTAPTPPQDGFAAFDDAFSELDKTPEPPTKPEPKEPETKLPEADKGKPAPDKGKVKAEPKAESKPQAEPEDDYEPPKQGMDAVRRWAVGMGKRAKQADAKVAELSKKLDELAKAPPPTNGHAPDPDMARKLTDYEQKVADYEAQLRLTKYERSQEYAEKHQKPIGIAEARARRDIESLVVEQKQKDPETGEEKIVSSRPGAWKDFHQIYNLSRPDARRTARALFGEDADLVMKHYDDIHQRWEDAHLAIEDYKKNGLLQESQEEAKRKQDESLKIEGWNKANEMFRTKHPEWFDEREGDNEGNELLNKGQAFVDTFMDPDDRKRYPVPQQIIADARIRNWAASFLRNQRDITKLKSDLAEAQGTIEKLRGSGPGPAGGGGETAKGEDDNRDWKVAFDKAVA
jgi:hypothetical protein